MLVIRVKIINNYTVKKEGSNKGKTMWNIISTENEKFLTLNPELGKQFEQGKAYVVDVREGDPGSYWLNGVSPATDDEAKDIPTMATAKAPISEPYRGNSGTYEHKDDIIILQVAFKSSIDYSIAQGITPDEALGMADKFHNYLASRKSAICGAPTTNAPTSTSPTATNNDSTTTEKTSALEQPEQAPESISNDEPIDPDVGHVADMFQGKVVSKPELEGKAESAQPSNPLANKEDDVSKLMNELNKIVKEHK